MRVGASHRHHQRACNLLQQLASNARGTPLLAACLRIQGHELWVEDEQHRAVRREQHGFVDAPQDRELRARWIRAAPEWRDERVRRSP
jgi:hypothetical protein